VEINYASDICGFERKTKTIKTYNATNASVDNISSVRAVGVEKLTSRHRCVVKSKDSAGT
jgi:hypothetical protein